MKSFTLISGILITLLGVFFFANPTNLLAIVGWLFALVMLISGVSSLMVYFKRDNENRSFFANNYPCLMAGVAMGRTLTYAIKAIKQMGGLE